MKYLIVLALLVFDSRFADTTAAFSAVSNFATLNSFYRQIRNETSTNEICDASLRSRICQEIFGSHFFKQKRVEYFDPEHMLNRRVWRESGIVTPEEVFRDTYLADYIDVDATKDGMSDDPNDLQPPARSRADGSLDVSALGGGLRDNPSAMKELVFLCLTRKRDSNAFQKWYVTKEYCVDRLEGESRCIVGRFVFQYVGLKYELVALAQEPAQIRTISESLESRYVEELRKDIETSAKKCDSDPICRLIEEPERHSRLCTVILNSSPFVDEVQETDTTKMLDDQCALLEVTIDQRETEAESLGSGSHFECMAVCKAESLKTKNQLHYYVSKAYKPDSVLLHKAGYPSKGKLVLINEVTNISVMT